jgi:hypothetical protein
MTIETQDYNGPAIRDLLTAAFMDSRDLRRFCQSHREFRPVLQLVNEGAGLQDHVDALIGYCDTYVLFDELLEGVERLNPRQYARFAPMLGERVPVGQEDLGTPSQDRGSESLAEQPLTTPAVPSATTASPLLRLLSTVIAALFPDLVEPWNEWLAKRSQ